MATFRSNLDSINNAALVTARANDTHSNDALLTLLTNIYTAVPSAVIVEQGVNYRVATSDFQAWAIYYNPDTLYNPAEPSNLEIISQYQPLNIWAYTGTFTIYDETEVGNGVPVGEYFVIDGVDYQGSGVIDVLNSASPLVTISEVLQQIGVQNFNEIGTVSVVLNWEDAGIKYETTFDATTGVYTTVCNDYVLAVNSQIAAVMLPDGGITFGQALPGNGTTGRWGLLLTNYNI